MLMHLLAQKFVPAAADQQDRDFVLLDGAGHVNPESLDKVAVPVLLA